MRPLILGLLLAACSAPEAPSDASTLGAPDDATVSGEVVSVDLDPLAYDGNAVLILRSEAGEQRVEIPARTNLCPAEGLGVALNATPGQRLTVTGTRTPDGTVVPCTSPAHAVRLG